MQLAFENNRFIVYVGVCVCFFFLFIFFVLFCVFIYFCNVFATIHDANRFTYQLKYNAIEMRLSEK